MRIDTSRFRKRWYWKSVLLAVAVLMVGLALLTDFFSRQPTTFEWILTFVASVLAGYLYQVLNGHVKSIN